jgi:hypothetical protein
VGYGVLKNRIQALPEYGIVPYDKHPELFQNPMPAHANSISELSRTNGCFCSNKCGAMWQPLIPSGRLLVL